MHGFITLSEATSYDKNIYFKSGEATNEIYNLFTSGDEIKVIVMTKKKKKKKKKNLFIIYNV